MLFSRISVLTLVVWGCFATSLAAQTITGELMRWHDIILTFDGPNTSETSTPNPFADYALEVTFTMGNDTLVVPGYYAADGDAAETSAAAGNQWRAHFSPGSVGIWNYSVSFKTGTDVAVVGGGSSAGFMDGQTGTITVIDTDKTGRDHRAKGRLEYVGEHYLRFAGSQEWFVKAGADAPENTLAYEDFDDVPNVGNRRKSWQPHQQDYDASSASAYTWQNGKGSELLGVVNYLASKGVNAMSFLTFSVEGDDKNVFPHLYDGNLANFNGNNAWSANGDLQHDRFDVSRMAQWERIFSYADLRGIYLHFKTQETENDDLMDGGDVDRERKLYYRELIARFGHHLALNWNMGEENTQTNQQRIDMAAYFAEKDPYQHLRVIHTYPGQKNQVYTPLLGDDSEFTGASLQTSNANQQQAHPETQDWVENSFDAGKKWVVAIDEPGNASIGVDSDPDDRELTRHRVVWGNFMAGGAGSEFYYGYQSGCGDLGCEDHRSRDEKYTDAALALQFFQSYFQPYLPDVVNSNELTTETDDYALTSTANAYAVYRPEGGTTEINLPAGDWEVSWYNPRDGSMAAPALILNNELIAPDDNDWAALILPEGALPVDWGDFTAEADGLDVILNWSTLREVNTMTNEVARFNPTTRSWEIIGSVPAAGSAVGPSLYTYQDIKPGRGTFLYRIKQIDLDGSLSWSAIREVTVATPGGVLVFPNPVNDFITVRADEDTVRQLDIFDSQGRMMKSFFGVRSQQYQIDDLLPGVYILQITTQEGRRLNHLLRVQ